MSGGANPPELPESAVREWVNALLQEQFLARDGCYRAKDGVVVQVIPVYPRRHPASQQERGEVDLRLLLASRYMPKAVNPDDAQADLAMLELALQDLREGDFIERLAACQKLGQLGLPNATTELRRVMDSDQNSVVRDAAERALSNVAEPRFPASAFIGQAVTLRFAEEKAAQTAVTNKHGRAVFNHIPADAICHLVCFDEWVLALRPAEASAAIAEFAQKEAKQELRDRLLEWAGLLSKIEAFGRSIISDARDAVMPTEAERKNWRKLVPWALEELLAGEEPTLYALQPAIRSPGAIRMPRSGSHWRGGHRGGSAMVVAPIAVEHVSPDMVEISIASPAAGGGPSSARLVLLTPSRPDLEPVLAELAWDSRRGRYSAVLRGINPREYLFALEPPY